MLTGNSLEDAVIDSLDPDPRIPDSNEIAVSADDGVVVLRGSVESFGQRRAAAETPARSRARTWSTTS